MFVTSVTSIHLKRMVQSNAADLLPNYRRYQLIAAGFVLACFLIWPVILTYYFGGPVLITLAIYLFSICIFLWDFFYWVDNRLFSFLGILITLLLLIDIYRFVGSSPKFSLITYLGNMIGSALSIYAIVFSLFGLFLFAFLYLKLSNTYLTNESDSSWLSSNAFDRTGAFTMKIVGKAISRASQIKDTQKSSGYRLIPLFQFGLFQPGLAANTLFIYFSIAMVLIITYWTTGILTVREWDYFLLALFYLCSLTLTIDFLQHRNNIATLYLQSDLSSRNSFIHIIAISYLWGIFKQIAVFALLLIFLQRVFHFTTWADLFQILAMGFTINLVYISISLLFSSKVKSEKCIGYGVINIIIMIFALPLTIFGLAIYSWIFVAACAFISSLLFGLAMRQFAKTEMDFIGPELPA